MIEQTESSDRRRARIVCAAIVLGLLALTASMELAMGRVPIAKSGAIRFWIGSTRSPELSQQITDWYSFSHVIHGMALYGLLHQICRRKKLPPRWRLIAVVTIEASWELLENSPIIINRYRQTAAQGYNGDSVLNSMCDILFCVLGFFLARKLPIWMTVMLILVMEVGVGCAIRDNLTLNVIMLIHPFAAIKRWQMAG